MDEFDWKVGGLHSSTFEVFFIATDDSLNLEVYLIFLLVLIIF